MICIFPLLYPTAGRAAPSVAVRPFELRAATSAFAASPRRVDFRAGSNPTCISQSTLAVPSVRYPTRVITVSPGPPQSVSVQPAADSTPSIRFKIFIGSASHKTAMSKTVPENGVNFLAISETCASDKVRSAMRVSRVIIFNCCTSILDCCAPLMPSSKTNRHTVQSNSTATPTITNHVAVRWIATEYLGASKSIPAPTPIPASTLPKINTKWGQNGAAVPEASRLSTSALPLLSFGCSSLWSP